MHRKENCSIPRLDLLDQSKFYMQHTEKLSKMKPAVNTSPVEPVKHFSVAHKEKEKEWEYADSISKIGYAQIQASKYKKKQFGKKKSISNLPSSRKNISNSLNGYISYVNNINISQKPQFNLRTNIFPTSPKGGIYNYPASFDNSSLSASGMISTNLSPKIIVDEDDSLPDSTSIFLTQEKKKDYHEYQYTGNPEFKQQIEDDQMQVSVKNGMKFVEFSGESKNDQIDSNDGLAFRLNSRLRKSFYIGSYDSTPIHIHKKSSAKIKNEGNSELYSYSKCDAKFNFHSKSKSSLNENKNKSKNIIKKSNKKAKRQQLIYDFENTFKCQKEKQVKRFIKLKILQSFLYEYFIPNEQLSISWADQNDLLSQDEIEINVNSIRPGKDINNYAMSIDKFDSPASTSTQTSVDFTFYDEEDIKPVHLAESPFEVFESFELELSLSQHVLDIALNDLSQSEEDEIEILEYSDSRNYYDEQINSNCVNLNSNTTQVKKCNQNKFSILSKALENIDEKNIDYEPNSEYSYYSDYDEA